VFLNDLFLKWAKCKTQGVATKTFAKIPKWLGLSLNEKPLILLALRRMRNFFVGDLNHAQNIMHFSLIDRIELLGPDSHIVATKSLSMAEEYLRDHFPNFPVMPGVLMLEALTQSAAWLIRVSQDFANSLVLLKEVKGVRYGKFVQPGQMLRIESSIVRREGNLVYVKSEGTVEDKTTLRGQLVLESTNVVDQYPERSFADEKLTKRLKGNLALIWPEYYPRLYG
jgi:3-hydroxyacyl-[acyl-carrier-protein] dehydratase